MPQAYHLAGLEYDPALVWGASFAPREHQPVIEAAVRHFLSLTPRPTAIFMCGDTYAISFYDALRASGLRIPDDMSVLGFDGSPLCGMTTPPLSSVEKPFAKMASEALSLLRRIVEGGEASSVKILVEPNLVERGSVLNIR